MSDETQVSEETQVEAIYVSARYAKLRGSYYVKDTEGNPQQVHFELEKGVLRLQDPEHIEALDKTIRENSSLSACLRRLDFSAAEETVQKHQAFLKSRTGGVKGPFTSESMLKLTSEQRLQASLGSEGTPETVAKVQQQLAEEGLTIPEDVKPVQQIPDPVVAGSEEKKGFLKSSGEKKG